MKKAIDGLVLRETPTGDYDKLLTVLTAEDGKLYITAKGARSMKSKVLPVCRLFTYGNLEIYEKNDHRWLSGGSVNDSFYGLNADIEGFSLASYIVQIADEITGEGVEASEILRMTLNTLYCIENKKKPRWLLKATYELFAARVSGFTPDLSACCRCRKRESGGFWLDVMNGKIICDACMKKRTGELPVLEVDEYSTRNILLPMDASAVASAEYVFMSDIQRIFAFNITEEESRENFCRAAEGYLLNHLERSFDTLDFYKSVID